MKSTIKYESVDGDVKLEIKAERSAIMDCAIKISEVALIQYAEDTTQLICLCAYIDTLAKKLNIDRNDMIKMLSEVE